jgi:hypothetical protein
MFERDYVTNTITFRCNSKTITIEPNAAAAVEIAMMQTHHISKQTAQALLAGARRAVLEAIAQQVMTRERAHAVNTLLRSNYS